LVPGDPQCLIWVAGRRRGLVDVGDDNGLFWQKIIAGQETFKLCGTDGRQDLGSPKKIVCLRQLLADQDGKDGGDGDG
jgi:hypothetical protein